MAKRSPPTIKVGEIVHRKAEFEEPTDQGGRVRRFVISDETEDRVGDVIMTNGWRFDNFKSNPVVLWAHNSRELPIGTAEIINETSRTLADVDFAKAEDNPFAESVFRLVKAGVIRATSVGFRPLAPPEPRFDTDGDWIGFKFIAQELLELSVVAIPALPTALATGKSLGVDDRHLQRLFVPPDGASAWAERQRHLRNTDLKRFSL